jgi:23S rRNA (uracil1939-C5)-methyltransferase
LSKPSRGRARTGTGDASGSARTDATGRSEGNGHVVQIAHLGRAGDGVAAASPLHIAGALPGERVRVGASRRERGIARAPLLEVLSASPLRRPVSCSVASRCGGCPLAHLARSGQLEAKLDWLRAALRAKGLDDTVPLEAIAPEPGSRYRARARLAWSPSRTRGALVGYREGDARDIVEPERCEVLAPELESARARITQALAPILAGSGELRLALTELEERERAAVLALGSSDAQPPALYRALEGLVADGTLAGASLRVGGASVATSFGRAEERSRDVDGRVLVAAAGSFRQAHLRATEALGNLVLAWSEPAGADVVELHAGHGHFSLSLAARARSLVAVELEGAATRALAENLDAHGLRAEVRTSDAAAAVTKIAAESLAKRRPRPSVVVLDPPRTGALDVMEPLRALGPRRAVYVSCDVATFARDVARLGPSWSLSRVAVLDLFPDTHHVELVARLDRRGP